MEIYISDRDREILRNAARKQLEFANMEENQSKIDLWYKHNDFQINHPMIHLEMWTFMHEFLDDLMECEGEFARSVEMDLRTSYMNQEMVNDDRVTPDRYLMDYDTWFEPFDLPIHVENAIDENGHRSLGHHFIPSIVDLEDDYDKLKPSFFGVDVETTMYKIEVIEDAIGDIMPVELCMNCLYSVPTQYVVHFMGLENMMFAMYDAPELFKEMMDRIADDTLAYYRLLEEKRVILPTTKYSSVNQGSWAFTRDLPGPGSLDRPFTSKDVWGFMDSQETVSIFPQMYEEFIFPCYRKISSQYGLLTYGCCEPVHPIWDSCLSKLDNLRRVSISPWCDEEFMGERLKDRKVIYQRKPRPNFLGVDRYLDEDAFRKHIRKTLRAARGCNLEITTRDVYTVHHDPEKIRRYVELIRQEIEDNWQ